MRYITTTKLFFKKSYPSSKNAVRSCLFCLKIGCYGTLEVLISNPHLDFQNCDPKISFQANLSLKNESCSFSLIIGTHSISLMIILIPTLVFWNSNPKSKFGPQKSKLSVLPENRHREYGEDADSYSNISFPNFHPWIHF